MRKLKFLSVISLILVSTLVLITPAHATANIDSLVSSMSTKQKVAQMIVPSFSGTSLPADFEALLNEYNFAGVILFGGNISGTEQVARLVDSLQSATSANPDKNSQLLITIDQEGGYITRLASGTTMPGNMALGATGDPENAYTAAKTIGTELNALGINTDFAPVSDTNNNPANPIIGVRSFSDDPEIVGEFASRFMKGLDETDTIAALKHFPGHGDTSTDTHSGATVVDKSYDELKSLELVPFQRLIDEGAGLIMTAHIQYPQIEDTTYTSIADGSTLTLPATLSEKIITDVLRTDMGYDGVVITDALNMGAISTHFDKYDTAKLAIEAGVDILLMPTSIDDLETYITTVADKIDNGEIDETKVDAAVKRILTLKDGKGLLDDYDVDIDSKVSSALSVVSTKASHDQEFELAKKAITIVKNTDNILPLSADDKTLVLYYYDSHYNAASYALRRLVSDGVISTKENVSFIDYTVADESDVDAAIADADNVVVINSLYGLSSGAVDGTFYDLISGYIDKANDSGKNTVFMSTHLPYDITRFENADAILATYLANGLPDAIANLESYTENIPKYGPNVIAAFYQIFDENATISGKLPVNIYALDDNHKFLSTISYTRGYGLTYASSSASSDDSSTKTEDDNSEESAATTQSSLAPNTGFKGTSSERGSTAAALGVLAALVAAAAIFILRKRRKLIK